METDYPKHIAGVTRRNRLRAKHCEALALTAFIQAGYQVALPFGDQSGWDFLASEGGRTWERIQVRSARPQRTFGFKVGLSCGGKSRKLRGGKYRTYSVEDLDCLVAVHPETGAIWRFSSEEIAGRTGISPKPDHLWISGMLSSTELARPQLFRASRRGTTVVSSLRTAIVSLPDSRPTSVPADTWDMIYKFMQGITMAALARQHGIGRRSVKDRIQRALYRLGKSGEVELSREIKRPKS